MSADATVTITERWITVAKLRAEGLAIAPPSCGCGREIEIVHIEGRQWMGGGFAVDHHYAAGLAEGMIGDGLEVR